VAAFPAYTAVDYARDAESLPIVSCVHVEATVGTRGPALLDPVQETRFVVGQVAEGGKAPPLGAHRRVGIVGHVDLAAGGAAVVAALAAHREATGGAPLHGVRTILNFHNTEPSFCWPQVGGDLLADASRPALEEGCVPCRPSWVGWEWSDAGLRVHRDS
jgi:hypothetical protein